MRLLERAMREVKIAKRKADIDAIGCVREAFGEPKSIRACVLPSTEGMENREMGLVQVQSICLLMDKDAAVEPGDGLCLEGETPQWRVKTVRRWREHVAVQAERRSDAE